MDCGGGMESFVHLKDWLNGGCGLVVVMGGSHRATRSSRHSTSSRCTRV